MNASGHTPVLVGIGTATQREADYRLALEPMDLMLQAVNAAGTDTGAAGALTGVQWVAVPRGRWRYTNPAGEIAHSIGAQAASTVLASVGVLQQTLIGEACSRIARGEAHTTLVAGADAGHRILRARIAGERASERAGQGVPDTYWEPAADLRHPVEVRAGLDMPVGLYAILESAFRHAQGWSVGSHRDRLAQMVAQFSHIAADNPDAWTRRRVGPEDVRDGSERNPMQAFPYTRLHCSSWSVDQAAALLFCSERQAEALGIPRNRWVYPLASTESNHMVPVSARASLSTCIGAALAGKAALDSAGLSPADLDLVDLYSCFPIAVETYAEALGLPLTRPLTVTGGMNFAGGPYNNYQLQSTARAARLLRAGDGRHALVSGVSGVLTKQGFGLWSREPGHGFVHQDLSDQVAREQQTLPVLDTYTGAAKVAGCTVLHETGSARRGVLLVDTPQGQRALATTTNEPLLNALEREEFVGRTVQVRGEEVVPAGVSG
jgi:acetyl-CoA C-acetyltransferase